MIIQTKIEVVNTKMEEMLGESDAMLVNMSFDLREVCAIREIIEDDFTEVETSKCHIYMRSGEYFMIFTPYKTILEQFKQ
jgi:hypothetical protein